MAAAALAGVLLLAGCDSDSGSGAGAESDAGEAEAERPGLAKRPNVVVVVTDDQTLEDLGRMPRTRSLIGERGASFSDYYVSFPLCCPSRATYLTGRYAHNSGVLSNDPEFGGGYPALQNRHTLAVWLDDAGYETASVGRYLNFYGVVNPTDVPPGWDRWVAPPGPSTYLMYDYELNEDGEIVSYGDRPADYQTDVYARKAVEFIRGRAGERAPFFLSVTPLAPHDENDEKVPSRFEGPRPAPRHAGELGDLELPDDPAFAERDVSDKPGLVAGDGALSAADRRKAVGSLRRRGRSLLAVDEMVDELVGALRETGELEETYLLFTSDNGYLVGEHGLDGKITPYDEVVRVPLLVRGPGIAAGTEVRTEAANVDLAPTIAELAGAEPTRSMDGRSLLPALRGRAMPSRDVLLENLDEARVPKQPLYAGLRNRRYSYVEYEPRGRELYDMRADPDQLENMAERPDARPLVERLSRRLAGLRDCKGRSCR